MEGYSSSKEETKCDEEDSEEESDFYDAEDGDYKITFQMLEDKMFKEVDEEEIEIEEEESLTVEEETLKVLNF